MRTTVGEVQCRCLGMKIESWNPDGTPPVPFKGARPWFGRPAASDPTRCTRFYTRPMPVLRDPAVDLPYASREPAVLAVVSPYASRDPGVPAVFLPYAPGDPGVPAVSLPYLLGDPGVPAVALPCPMPCAIPAVFLPCPMQRGIPADNHCPTLYLARYCCPCRCLALCRSET